MVWAVALVSLSAFAADEPDPPGFRRPTYKLTAPAAVRQAVEAGTAERLDEAQQLRRSIEFQEGVVARLKAAKPVSKGKGTKFAPEISAETIAARLVEAEAELAGFRTQYLRVCADVGLAAGGKRHPEWLREPLVEVVGHRGASWDAPENTVASVKLAWEQRADAAEFDVYLCKDGQLVVLHDKTLKRTAGVDRAVTDLTAAELGQLDAGRWKGGRFAGEPVPTLAAVLATVPAGKRVFIEVKCGPECVPELDRVLKASGLKPEQTAVISFSAEVVAAVKAARPDLLAYWIVSLAPKKGEAPPTAAALIARAQAIHADGLDLSATPAVLTPAFARQVRAAGLALYVWTVNDPAVARAMVAAGVEGVTTDRPGWLRERLADDPTDLRVMSFNIRYGTAKDGDNHWDKRKSWLVETVATFDPDLLGTQETEAAQRDFLAAKLPGHTAFAAGRDDGQDKGESAALFYRTARFERLTGGHFWLSPTPEAVGAKGWDAALPRIATWVKLKDRTAPAAPPIFYLNTHLDHRGKQARVESAKLIRAKLAELGAGCRLVVTGDFNAGEASEPYAALFDGGQLADTFRLSHPKAEPGEGTFSGFKADATGGARIDWIASSREWAVRSAGIDHTSRDGRTPSDHFSVTAVLRPTRPVRVLSYNIHHGEGTDGKVDLPRLAAVIKAADPDLVALQEVDDKTKRTGGVDQTAELARLTGMHGRFGKAIDYQGGGYGQAILTREPPTAADVHFLPGEPDRERRIAFAVRVPAGGREVLFITTHLHHANAAFRERQAAELTKLFAGADRPVILAGDFNATPEAKAVTLLADTWASATADPGLLSFPAEKPAKQIDYVFTRTADRLRASAARVVAEPVASDHRPVAVTLEW